MKTRNICCKGALWLCVAMSLIFWSCEKELTSGGAARIRIAIADVPYGSGAGVNRSAKAAKSETVVVPLDREDGLCLYATLKENRSETDSELRAFTPGARLRIAVYDDSDVFVKSVIGSFFEGTFTLDGGETLDDVTPGVDYTFVAYSVNLTTGDPDSYVTGDAIENFYPEDDLLYGKSTLTTISSGTNTVVIPLAHKLSEVTVALDASAISGENYISLNGDLEPAYAVNMPLIGASAGVMSPGSYTVSQSLFFPYNSNEPVVQAQPRLVFTNGENPTRVNINGLYFNYVEQIMGTEVISFPFSLEPGTRYTLTIALRESSTGLWAGSNIYWDGDRLTFDAMGKTDHALYQGVYFKFGSLVGVSGSEAMDVNTTTMYVPDYNALNQWDSDWHPSTIAAEGWTDWDDIPYITPVSGNYPLFLYERNISDFEDMKGDICKYIGDTGAGPSGYRMPTYDEFETGYGVWDLSGDFPRVIETDEINPVWSEGNPAGTALFDSYFYMTANNNIKFPPSGFRSSWEDGGRVKGQLGWNPYALGQMAYYRGGSIGNGGEVLLYLEGGGVYEKTMDSAHSLATAGCPIRCIKRH
jgi:hypothetical protein